MHKTLLALLVGLMLAAPAVAAGEAGLTWYDDFDKAAAAAKAEGKDLLVDFTGSDWCGWCVRLHKEVFAHDEFNEGVKDKYILVALDFPKAPEVKAKVPNPDRNQELMQKYQVGGFPSILLMKADGEVYARTGYQQGGPAAYLTHLAEITKTGQALVTEAKVYQKAFEDAADAEKAAAIEKAMATLGDLGAKAMSARKAVMMDRQNPELRKAAGDADTRMFLQGMILKPIVKSALTVDPKNESGLQLKALTTLMETGGADDDVFAAVKVIDSKNEHGLLEKVMLAKFGKVRQDDLETMKAILGEVAEFQMLGVEKDKALCTQLYANSAYCYHKFLKDNRSAAVFAKKLQAMGADQNPRLKELITMILAAAETEAATPTEEKPADEKSAE